MRQQSILPSNTKKELAGGSQSIKCERRESILISAGFPCQDASTGNPHGKGIEGYRTGKGWDQTYRIIREIKPEYIFLENVPNLLNRGWGKVLAQLSQSGYNVWQRVIPAKNFGFTFEGKRIYAVAVSSGCFGWQAFQLLTQRIDEALQGYQTQDNIAGAADVSFWSEEYPEFLRKDHGLSAGTYRITALGNACIPIFPEIIIGALNEFDKWYFEN